jgi:dolichyl-phosphate-mannose-protein mannosyltransferase
MMTKSNFYLPAIICGGIALRVLLFSGYQGGDDTAYIARAFLYSAGDFSVPYSHWGGRILPVGLTALSYGIFGISDKATALFPFLASAVGIIVAYFIGRQVSDKKVALLAAFLVAIFPMEVFFASQLFPYSLLSTLSALTLLVFLKGESTGNAKLFFLAGVVLGLAYLSRVTALYALIFFALYAISRQELLNRKYPIMALGLLTILIGEAIIGYLQSGDFLQRFHILMHRGTFTTSVTMEVNHRVFDFNWFVEPVIRPLFEQEIGPYFLLLGIIIAYQLFWGKDKNIKVLLLWIVPIFLYISYGTTSPADYHPLRRLPRYLSIIIIPAMVLIAYQLIVMRNKKISSLIVGLLFIFSLSAFSIDNSRYVAERERKLAEYIAENPEYEFIIQRSLFYSVLYFNRLVAPGNATLYAKEDDVSHTYKRIKIVAPDVKEVRTLSELDGCRHFIAREGGYINNDIVAKEGFEKVVIFSQTRRLYDQLKESPMVLFALNRTRDQTRLKELKNSSSNEIALYRRVCE